MTLTFELNADDYLVYQLFVFSRSQKMQDRRKRNRLFIPLVYLAIGCYFWLSEEYEPAVGFCIAGPMWYFFYPNWERKRYKRYYLEFVNENYYERFGRTVTLGLSKELITVKDSGTESNIKVSELKEVHELPAYILIVLKGSSTIILPKNSLDTDEVVPFLQEIARHAGASYNLVETWEWS